MTLHLAWKDLLHHLWNYYSRNNSGVIRHHHSDSNNKHKSKVNNKSWYTTHVLVHDGQSSSLIERVPWASIFEYPPSLFALLFVFIIALPEQTVSFPSIIQPVITTHHRHPMGSHFLPIYPHEWHDGPNLNHHTDKTLQETIFYHSVANFSATHPPCTTPYDHSVGSHGDIIKEEPPVNTLSHTEPSPPTARFGSDGDIDQNISFYNTQDVTTETTIPDGDFGEELAICDKCYEDTAVTNISSTICHIMIHERDKFDPRLHEI